MDFAELPKHEDVVFNAFSVLRDAAEGFVACDSALRIVFLNSAAERLCGKSVPELLGTILWEPSYGLGGSELKRASRRVLAENVPAKFEYHRTDLAAWFEVSISPAERGGIS